MRIAITCQEDNLDSNIDQRFGRSKYFLIANIENNNVVKVEAALNQGAEQGRGAGIRAAEQLGELKAEQLLTGQLGPNATEVLRKLGIKAYAASGKAKEAIEKLLKGELSLINEAAEPHQEKTTKTKISDASKGTSERIFFPLLDNNGMDSEISEHFGHAPFFGLYNVEKKELKIIENDLDHADPSKSPIEQIEESVNPTTIFAKGIGGRAVGIIQQKGMALKTGDYKTVGDAIKNLDKLEDQTNDCGHKH